MKDQKMSLFKIISRTMKTVSTENVREILKKSEHGFEGVLKKVKIIKCDNGTCIAEMKIHKEHANPWNGLHGGLSATLVDSITTYALFTHEKSVRVPSVSVDIHISYLKGATIDEEIIIVAETVRVGKTLAYLKCEIKNKATGDVLVKGSHTKYLMRGKQTPRAV